jgi:DNA-binding MarR family transcriptional regulator
MSLPVIQPKAGVLLPETPCADTRDLAEFILFFQRSLINNLSRELSGGNVSFAQFFLLTALERGESLTMSEIAVRMRHTTAAATGLVDRLEALGYVERAHSTEDRRKVMVKITERGSALVGQIKEDMIHNLSAVMTYLSGAEQKAWVQIYRKIYGVIQSQHPC